MEAILATLPPILYDNKFYIVGVAGVLLTYFRYRRPPGSPPGPPHIPLIGCLNIFPLLLGENIVTHMQRMHRYYGDVMMINFGPDGSVFLNNPEIIREAFVKKADILSSRPNRYIIRLLTRGKGVAMVDGTVWKEQRKFTVSVFRDIGVCKLRFEDRIMDSIQHLTAFLRQNSDRSIDPSEEISMSVADVIGNIIFGVEHFQRDSEDTRKFISFNAENFRTVEMGFALDSYPELHLIPGDPFHKQRTKTNMRYMRSYGERSVRWHRENPPEDGEPRDFIDAYLQRTKEVENTEYGATAGFSDEQLLHIITDLFSAGIDTTTNSLRWLFLYMAAYTEVQHKVREELNTVFADDQPPSLHCRSECKYTDAVMYEIQRIVTIAPFALPHSAKEAVTIGGYHIPKDTVVFANLYALHHDPRFWDEPEKFRPERFLDSNGELAARQDAFMPFSVGRRMCLGDSLARMEMFLFFSSVMKEFTVSLSPVNLKPSFAGTYGITYPPKPHKLIFSHLNKT